ncbi:hypothetical protein JW766_00915 [Candidatus Dojkabacteria bacterium]|nr:hypothetical protein [Candidatus Dojkabacteria bacterium]
MGEETELVRPPIEYCPDFARAFEDIDGPETLANTKFLPTLPTLLRYFFVLQNHLLTTEARENLLAPPSNLSIACKYILDLFSYFPPIAQETIVKVHDGFDMTDRIIDFNELCIDSPHLELSQYDVIAYGHGGYVGTPAHIKILTIIAAEIKQMRAERGTNGAIVIGLESDEYLDSKRMVGDRYLRPWPLIVTVALSIHLSKILDVPIYIFFIPPRDPACTDLDAFYGNIYDRVRGGQTNVQIILSMEDKFRTNKISNMTQRGVEPQEWAQVFIIPGYPHTSDVLRELVKLREEEKEELRLLPEIHPIPTDYHIVDF